MQQDSGFPATLDPDRVSELAADPAILRDLLTRFAARLRADPPALVEARRGGADEDALRLAHSLKSVAATFGAGAVSAAAGRTEALLRDGEGDPELGALQSECARSADAIEEWLRHTT